jgi:hypothetical protein
VPVDSMSNVTSGLLSFKGPAGGTFQSDKGGDTIIVVREAVQSKYVGSSTAHSG